MKSPRGMRVIFLHRSRSWKDLQYVSVCVYVCDLEVEISSDFHQILYTGRSNKDTGQVRRWAMYRPHRDPQRAAPKN